ncbi:MAG: peroxiredoxin, partial [Phycisphaerales bacterium]|nr:peroxiredoxin [Phycisphaerales bacterium]
PASPLPPFALTSARGTTLTQDDLLGAPFILYCYPAADTPACTRQACDFSAAPPDLARLASPHQNRPTRGTRAPAATPAAPRIIGISPDTPDKLARFAAKHNLTITLLADPPAPQPNQPKAPAIPRTIAALGCWGQKSMYGKTYMGVIRTTYLVNAQGLITHAWPNVKVPGHAQAVLQALANPTAATNPAATNTNPAKPKPKPKSKPKPATSTKPTKAPKPRTTKKPAAKKATPTKPTRRR